MYTLKGVFEELEALGLSIPETKPEPRKHGRKPRPRGRRPLNLRGRVTGRGKAQTSLSGFYSPADWEIFSLST